jgi:hypothetical protein
MPQSGREGQFLFLQAKCLKLQTFQAPKIINCLHRLFVCLIVVVIMLNLSQKMVKKHKCCSFYFYCQTYFVMLRHGCYIVTCNLFGDCRLLRPPYVKILAPPLMVTSRISEPNWSTMNFPVRETCSLAIQLSLGFAQPSHFRTFGRSSGQGVAREIDHTGHLVDTSIASVNR